MKDNQTKNQDKTSRRYYRGKQRNYKDNNQAMLNAASMNRGRVQSVFVVMEDEKVERIQFRKGDKLKKIIK